MKQIKISYEIFNPSGADEVVSLLVPAKNCICDRCEGDGKVDNPAFSNGFSQDELDEDPDFKEAYFEGRYDVRCPECNGRGIVQIANVSQMTFAQKRFAVKVRQFDIEKAQFEREYEAECAAERRMGC